MLDKVEIPGHNIWDCSRSAEVRSLECHDCIAILAAELVSRIKTDLKITGATSYLWMDFQSEVLPAFAIIHPLSRKYQRWHVKSTDNLADVLPRLILT